MTRKSNFHAPELTRAIKGAVKAGAKVTGAEIDNNGKIKLIFGSGPIDQTSALEAWGQKWCGQTE